MPGRIYVGQGEHTLTYRKTVISKNPITGRETLTVECDEGHFVTVARSIKEGLLGLNIKPGDKFVLMGQRKKMARGDKEYTEYQLKLQT